MTHTLPCAKPAVLLCPLHPCPSPRSPPRGAHRGSRRCRGVPGGTPVASRACTDARCTCVCVCVCVRVRAAAVCTGGAGSSGHPPPAAAAAPAPAPARGAGDAAGAGGGSMASPRAAELRSPGEAAAAAAGGGGPVGPGAGPGLALALGCALSGAALVVLAGAVPRAARPDPAVPARQMERLEARAARLRARLDRCTVAGLALLALGGLLLAALLLAAAAARRRARAARRTGGTYGSVRLRMRRVSAEGTRALLESQLSPLPQPPEGPGS
ncbi:transmembrane protein 74B [Sarcoramphus papa]